MYLKGRGVVKDEDKGYDFLAKAAEGGEAAAMFDLGQVLRSGLFGRKAQPEAARNWLARAAATGHGGAILALAAMLKDGSGGKADPEGALRWYIIAQKSGMSGEALDAAIRELLGKLPPGVALQAEKAADAWMAAKANSK